MRIFPPNRQITYISSLTKKEILKRLSDNIDPDNNKICWDLLYDTSTKLYEGTLTGNHFKMRKKQYSIHGDLCDPEITGVISSIRVGTEIKVKMKMNQVAAVIWYFIMGVIFALGIISLNSYSTEKFKVFYLALFFIILAGVTMPYAAFRHRTIQMDKELRWILQAEIVK